jgi:hypothetical protein
MNANIRVRDVNHHRSTSTSTGRSNVESDEHTLGVRQIADNFADWRRQSPYESWNRQYLVSTGELRVLQKIDDFNLVFSTKVFFTDLLEIRNGFN